MTEETEAVDICCASCGIAEVDDIKLKDCDDCDLVRYCSDECKKDHKSQHEEECKQRVAELRDELLFKQPESRHLGDCPICCLPMPLELKKTRIYECCSKVICHGCFRANNIRDNEMRRKKSCPFCREPLRKTDEEGDKMRMKRIEANDPAAMCQEGTELREKRDFRSAFEYFTKAAELGDVDSHHSLSYLYHAGHGVEKDIGKAIYHMKEAAIGGHPVARYRLGREEWINGNTERAVKHWTISAKQGHDDSIKWLMKAFKRELVPKEVLAAALRAHHAAVYAIKSPQREAAELYYSRKNS